jgi:transcriptional regulator with XRE-family HTH domain
MTEQPGAAHGVPEFHLGDRLAKALEVAGVSNQEMADYLGVSRNTVGNYIHMRTPVTTGTLRLWALRTGVRMEWLQTGKAPSGGNPDQGSTVTKGKLYLAVA